MPLTRVPQIRDPPQNRDGGPRGGIIRDAAFCCSHAGSGMRAALLSISILPSSRYRVSADQRVST